MKTNQNFTLLFALMLVCQIFLCNFANLGPMVFLSMLPAMILCIPTSVGTAACLIAAFASGLTVDWLSEGLLGLNAAALLPVAAARKWFIRIFLGEDLLARNDSFSIRKNGIGKVSFALLASLILFLAVYIFLDGAGTRPFWFGLTRFLVSLMCNWLLGLIVIKVLTTDDRK